MEAAVVVPLVLEVVVGENKTPSEVPVRFKMFNERRSEEGRKLNGETPLVGVTRLVPSAVGTFSGVSFSVDMLNSRLSSSLSLGFSVSKGKGQYRGLLLLLSVSSI